MTRIKMLFACVTIGFSISAMDSVELVKEDAEQPTTKKIDSNTLGPLIPDMWKYVLRHVSLDEPLSHAFRAIGQLRAVNRSFNGFLHEKPVLASLVRNSNYPEEMSDKQTVLKYLSLYIGSLLSRTPSVQELQTLQLLRSKEYTCGEIYDVLTQGPYVTAETLAQDIPLVRCLLAMQPVIKPSPARQNVFMTKLTPLFFREDVLLQLGEFCKEEDVYDIRSALTLLTGKLASTELSHTSLMSLFSKEDATLTDLPKVDVEELYRRVIEHFVLSDVQRDLFEAARVGNSPVVDQFLSTKKSSICPVTADLALLIAIKSGHTKLAQRFVKAKLVESRDPNGLGLYCWLIFETIKLVDDELCNTLPCSIVKGLPPVNPAISLSFFGTSCFASAETPEELNACCTVLDALLLHYGLPAVSRDFLQACYEENIEFVKEKIPKLDAVNKPYVISAVLNMACMRGLLDVIRVLKKDPIGTRSIMDGKTNLITQTRLTGNKPLEDLLTQLSPLEMSARIIMIVREFGGDEECLKRNESVSNFVKLLQVSPHDQAIISAAQANNRDFLLQQLVPKTPDEETSINQLLVDLVLLSAISSGHTQLVLELLNVLPPLEDNLSPEMLDVHRQISCWMLMLSTDKAQKEVCKVLFERHMGLLSQLDEQALLVHYLLSIKTLICNGAQTREGFELVYDLLSSVEHPFKISFSKEWFLACWDDDSQVLSKSNDVFDKDDCLLLIQMCIWACKVGRPHFLAWLRSSEAGKTLITSNLQTLLAVATHYNNPEIVSVLNSLDLG